MRFSWPDITDRKWHCWFAWRPVYVRNLDRWVWLEFVGFRYVGGFQCWEYRA